MYGAAAECRFQFTSTKSVSTVIYNFTDNIPMRSGVDWIPVPGCVTGPHREAFMMLTGEDVVSAIKMLHVFNAKKWKSKKNFNPM